MERLRELCNDYLDGGGAAIVASYAGKERHGHKFDTSEEPFVFAKNFLDKFLTTDDIDSNAYHRLSVLAYFTELCDWSKAEKYPSEAGFLAVEMMAVVAECSNRCGDVKIEAELKQCRAVLRREALYSAAKGVTMEHIVVDLFERNRHSNLKNLQSVLPAIPHAVIYEITQTSGDAEAEHDWPKRKQIWTLLFDILLRIVVPDGYRKGADTRIRRRNAGFISDFFARAYAYSFLIGSLPTTKGPQYVLHAIFYRLLYGTKDFSNMSRIEFEALAEAIFRDSKFHDDLVAVINKRSAHYGRRTVEETGQLSRPKWHLLTLREIMEESRFPELAAYIPTYTKSARS